MSDAGKAVFLSYASQDAEAAKRIANALRAAGVEVWFDQSELRGGDAWDQSIRKQIKECALFVPIISANTQARREGYFRLEWKLADDRTHLMAKGTRFILPVCVDDTRDWDAIVPDSFTTVQWTRLSAGEGAAAFAERVGKLLSGNTPAVGDQTKAVRPVGASLDDARGRRPAAPLQISRPWLAPAVAILVALTALALWRPWQRPPAGGVESAVVAAAKPASEARGLVEKASGLFQGLDATREDFALAEEFCQRALKLDPNDGEVWAAYAQLNAAFGYRGWDPSPERREQNRVMAERAIRLAPRSAQARLAQAGAWSAFGVNRPETEKLLRDIVREEPANQAALRFLAVTVLNNGGLDECLALNERSAALPGGDPLALFNNARYLWQRGRPDEGYASLQRSLAQQPFSSGLTLKALMEITWRGDPAAAEAALRQIPQSALLEDRANYMAGLVHYYQRNAGAALAAWAAFPRDYYMDFAYDGPKGLLIGHAHELDQREAAAKIEWRTALQAVDKRLAITPNHATSHYYKAYLLACLGEKTAAEEALRTCEQLRGIKYTRGSEMPFELAVIYARLGRFDEIFAHPPNLLRRIRIDPRFEAFRADPRYQALVAASASRRPASGLAEPASADHKSVAVLAFANLSDDKANEYFSDGISEELLNVLAKVPGLKVTARTSAFHFKGKDTPISEIARQLGVAYVVEGSVRKAGDKVRITAQLIKAADGFHVWSDTFTRDLKDVFAVQDEISSLIAQNLKLKLAAGGAAGAATNPEAYRLYLEGRRAWNRRDLQGFRQAEVLLSQAIELDPGFARAHAALADVWSMGADSVSEVGPYNLRDSVILIRARAKAKQALTLDPNCAEAYASLGQIAAFSWDFASALRDLQRAVELNPNYASARQWLGAYLKIWGDPDRSLAETLRAVELDPLSHRILDQSSDTLLLHGRVQEAWELLERARALNPAGIQIRCKRALLLFALGRREEALAAARELAGDSTAEQPAYRFQTALEVLAGCGFAGEAEAMLQRIPTTAPERVVALAILGRTSEALSQLDGIQNSNLDSIMTDPRLAGLRAEPAFKAWQKKVGLSAAQQRLDAWMAAPPRTKVEASK